MGRRVRPMGSRRSWVSPQRLPLALDSAWPRPHPSRTGFPRKETSLDTESGPGPSGQEAHQLPAHSKPMPRDEGPRQMPWECEPTNLPLLVVNGVLMDHRPAVETAKPSIDSGRLDPWASCPHSNILALGGLRGPQGQALLLGPQDQHVTSWASIKITDGAAQMTDISRV